MFDHVGFNAADLEASKTFYVACLEPLGFNLLQENEVPGQRWLVFGQGDGKPFFVVSTGKPGFWTDEHRAATSPIHVAFSAPDRAAVDAFYDAGLAAGGRDNGKPGPRDPDETYYAAYLIDPDGNNIEASVREKAS